MLFPVLLIGWCFYPGHMSADTLAQIDQAKRGYYTNQHAPILMWVWHPFFSAGFGPGWALLIQLLAFSCGTYLALRVVFSPVGSAFAGLLVALSPVVMGMLGYLSRDVWFTAGLVLMVGLTVRAFQDERHRRVWLIALGFAAWMTIAARQNAAPAILAVLAVALIPWVWARVTGSWKRVIAAAVAGGVATVALMGSQFALGQAIGIQDVNPDQYIYVYDIAAMSHRDQVNYFPRSSGVRSIAEVNKFWNVDSVNPLFFLPDSPFKAPLPQKTVDDLREKWVSLVTGRPGGYLAERWDIFKRQIAIGRRAVFVYHPGIDPNPYGYAIKHVEANTQAKDYVDGFADANNDGEILYTLWVYLLISIVTTVLLLRSGRREVQAVGSLALAGLAYQVGLFLGPMGTQYRLEFPMVVATIITAIVAVAVRRRDRPPRPV